METGASPAISALYFSSSASISTVVRRHCSSRIASLPDRTSIPSALRRTFPSSLSCRASMSETSGTIKESYSEKWNDYRESSIMTLSSLDGCYAPSIKTLHPFLSDFGLMRFQVMVEVKWLLKLSEIPEVEVVSEVSKDARSFLIATVDEFSFKDALEVKKIEEKTNDDVKAFEIFLRKKCESVPEILKVLDFFHFGCTSRDINNLAYALSIKEALNTVLFPEMVQLIKVVSILAKYSARIPILPHTHWQTTSLTTLGKEFLGFASSLCYMGKSISGCKISGSFAGTAGNYSALKVAYPNVYWPNLSEEFVTSLGLTFEPYASPVRSHEYLCSLFHDIIRFNDRLISIDEHIRSYISLGYFNEIAKSTGVGSSIMPHKVNPIDFQNSEDSLFVANVLLRELGMKVKTSNIQRDGTSIIRKSIGLGLGHCHWGYLIALEAIKKLEVDDSGLDEDLDQSWEVPVEPIHIM